MFTEVLSDNEESSGPTELLTFCRVEVPDWTKLPLRVQRRYLRNMTLKLTNTKITKNSFFVGVKY